MTAYTLAPLNVDGPNLRTVEFFASTGCKVYAELGVYRGDTAGRIADLLAGEGEVHLFDYEDRVLPVAEALARRGHRNVVAHPNTRRTLDSYNWSLMKLLRDAERPIFDTWALDALAFLLSIGCSGRAVTSTSTTTPGRSLARRR